MPKSDKPDFRYRIRTEYDDVAQTWTVKLDLMGFPDQDGATALARGFRNTWRTKACLRA